VIYKDKATINIKNIYKSFFFVFALIDVSRIFKFDFEVLEFPSVLKLGTCNVYGRGWRFSKFLLS
jgi:hypothetical protein